MVISVSALTKRFGRTPALDGLELHVAEGEVHGFLGPNGAGKSTTIRVLLGMLRADAGRVTVLGGDPWRDAVELHRRIAAVAGDVALWPGLTGGETIDFLTGRRGGADPALRTRLLADFDLDPRKRISAYSKGNRQKVALVAAFARRADLYVLDESTSGLDPLMEEVFRSEIDRVRADGATVLLSSHLLAEVERLCDRVTIVREGRVVEAGALDELQHLTRTTVRVASDVPEASLAALPGVHAVAREAGRLRFDVDAEAMRPVLALLAEHGADRLAVAPPSLEDVFLRHYASAVRA